MTPIVEQKALGHRCRDRAGSAKRLQGNNERATDGWRHRSQTPPAPTIRGRVPHAYPGRGLSMWSTTLRPAFRGFVGAVAVGVALAATSGCTVPADAAAGISVTADGHLLGVMMVCGHQIDGATLYVDSDDVNEQVDVGSWTADSPLKPGLATWTLDSPAAGWTATRSLAPLTSESTYTLYGWTKDNSWSACGARKVVAAVQAAYRYSLMTPPRMRVRRSLRPSGSCTAVGCWPSSGGSWLRARWGRCLLWCRS